MKYLPQTRLNLRVQSAVRQWWILICIRISSRDARKRFVCILHAAIHCQQDYMNTNHARCCIHARSCFIFFLRRIVFIFIYDFPFLNGFCELCVSYFDFHLSLKLHCIFIVDVDLHLGKGFSFFFYWVESVAIQTYSRTACQPTINMLQQLSKKKSQENSNAQTTTTITSKSNNRIILKVFHSAFWKRKTKRNIRIERENTMATFALFSRLIANKLIYLCFVLTIYRKQ